MLLVLDEHQAKSCLGLSIQKQFSKNEAVEAK